MPYIYKIINDINGKIYIGKTQFSIEKRWKEHCRDYQKDKNKKRPLYAAMRKYGVKHFHISLIEETDNPEEREKYWIEYYGSFKNGYNATIGGDGRTYLDYDLVYNLFLQGLNIKQIAERLNYSINSCRNILHQYGVRQEDIQKRGKQSIKKIVIQKDRDTQEILNIFPSIQEAYNFLGKRHSGHIADVCNKKRKTAYGYVWEYG